MNNKLIYGVLLATLLSACASQPKSADTAAAGSNSTATPVATAPASNPEAEAAAAAARKAAEEQALKDAAAKDAQARAEADKRMQENLLKANSVYFAFDQFSIDDEYKSVIETHAANAKSSNAKLRVEGNTDERGSREYNLSLGQKRANAVATALQLLGVAKANIETVSYGEEKPRAEGSDEDAWSVNRRADIIYK